MGVVSASDLSEVAAQETSAESAAEDYIAIVKSSEDFKKKVVGGLLKTITKFTGETAESLAGKGLTPSSEVAPALHALLRMIKGITGEKTEIASGLETATAANAKLAEEKAAAEAALAEAREKLEAVTAEKGVVDGKLATASDKVTELEDSLVAATAAATAAGRDAEEVTSELRSKLATAQENARILTTKVEVLAEAKAKAEQTQKDLDLKIRTIQAEYKANLDRQGDEIDALFADE